MPHIVISLFIHLIPALLVISAFFLVFDVKFKSSKITPTPPQNTEPDIDELEQKLQKLIEANNLNNKDISLQQELAKTPTHIISAYLHIDKKFLSNQHYYIYLNILLLLRMHL